MSVDIKTWQDRAFNEYGTMDITSDARLRHMKNEIAALRAALAAKMEAPVVQPVDEVEDETIKAMTDCMIHGTGITRGGKHVPLDQFETATHCDRNAVMDEAANTLEFMVSNATEWNSSSWDQAVMRCVNVVLSLKSKPAAPQSLMDDKGGELTDEQIDLIVKQHSTTLRGWEWSGEFIEVNGWREYEFVRAIIAATKGADKP